MTRKEMVARTRDIINNVSSKLGDGISIVDTSIDSIPFIGDILSLPTKVAKVVVPNAIKLGGFVGAPIGVAIGEEFKRKIHQPKDKGYDGVFRSWNPTGPDGDLIPEGSLYDKWTYTKKGKGK